MNYKPVFCFIDDAKFELENFKKHAAPDFKGVEFVYASNFEGAMAQLSERMPLCFLLDIYGSVSGLENPRLPSPDSLVPVLERPLGMADIYSGVEREGDLTPEAGNAFLRRLYSQVEAWQSAFQASCLSLGQGNAYGLGNLAQVRTKFPWAAALGYSRKALFDDAAAMMIAGADGLLRKPQGADDAAIAKATKEAAPELAREAFAAVDRRLAGKAAALGLGLCQDGDNLPLAEAILEGVRLLDPLFAGEPGCSRDEAAEALAAVRLEDAGLSQEAVGLIIALKRWLGRMQA